VNFRSLAKLDSAVPQRCPGSSSSGAEMHLVGIFLVTIKVPVTDPVI